MYTVHILVLLSYYNICLVSAEIEMSNLVPLGSTKMEIRHDRAIQGIALDLDLDVGLPLFLNGSCALLPPTTYRRRPTFLVDFFDHYPIHLVILRGNVRDGPASIRINLDKHIYANVSFVDESKIVHTPVLSGQILSITTLKKITICSLVAYTCKPGKKGDSCDQKCEAGLYGLGCKQQCRCPKLGLCNHVSGHCRSGCGTSPLGMPELCEHNSVGVATRDYFRWTSAAAMSISQGPTTDLKSARVHGPSEQCISVVTQCESKSMYLELTLQTSIHLYGVELTFTKFHIPAPFSISILSDKKPCYGLTSHNNSLTLKKHVFKCYRRDVTGKKVTVRITTYNKTVHMNAAGVGVHVCHFRALDCSPGFYGPNCRHFCQCAGFECDKISGACPQGRCNTKSGGRFCTLTDVAAKAPVLRKHYDSSLTTRLSPSWLAIQLDDVYFINSATVILKGKLEDASKEMLIIKDPSVNISSLDIRVKPSWRGLPCKVPRLDQDHQSRDVVCPGLAKTLFLVVSTNSSFMDISDISIRVWVCLDGTFGSECEHRCNCKDQTEACEKGSGACLSGCATGYKGVDCLQPCLQYDTDPVCPTTSCHCWGHHLDECGPNVPLCSHGCHWGWVGVSCSLPCPKGYFGYQCQEKCGLCRYDETGHQDGTCLHTNGTCPLGCADPNDHKPTCRNKTEPRPHPPRKETLVPSFRDARYERAMEESSFNVVLGLIGVIFACTSLVVLICCSLKCYWDRLAHSKRLNEKRVDMIMRRAMRSQMDTKVQGEHQLFHEAYLKRDMIKKLGDDVDQPGDGRSSKAKAKAKADAIRRMILEMETQRRMKQSGAKTPAAARLEEEEEDDEQDPDEKVAFWILKQDFSELIERRKKRLKEYTGNPLHMTESPYRISEVSLVKDVHKLYDDVEHLGIP